MADSTEVFRYGETRTLKVTLTPESGTLTLSSPTVTLKDSHNAVVGGIDGTACTDFQSGAQDAPWASYLFDTTAIWASEDDFVGQNYTLAFVEPATNGDTIVTVIGIIPRRLCDP